MRAGSHANLSRRDPADTISFPSPPLARPPSRRDDRCDTLLPVTAYTRRLSNSDGESASRVRRKLQARKQEMEEEQRRQHTDEMSVEAPPGTDLLQIGSSEETVTLPAAESQHGSDNAVSFFAAAAERPFTDHVARGNLCAFVAGRADEVEQWEVAVTSILLFVPGMRIAVAAEADGVDAYQRCGVAINIVCVCVLRVEPHRDVIGCCA